LSNLWNRRQLSKHLLPAVQGKAKVSMKQKRHIAVVGSGLEAEKVRRGSPLPAEAGPPSHECRLLSESLEQLATAVNECRQSQGCGAPPCGQHAVGKPTHQSAVGPPILVVGEAPAADGWWVTGRAFYRRTTDGVVLSRTGVNLNDCLAVLGTTIEDVGFIEAVRCRPDEPGPWHPGESVRRRCRPFLERHLRLTEPRLILPLGLTATTSCLEVAFAHRPASLQAVVGTSWEWAAPWGCCWIVPLYHPSPANGARWQRNKLYLQTLLKERVDPCGKPFPSVS
jgi:uracil-DNA glycosylase family 4